MKNKLKGASVVEALFAIAILGAVVIAVIMGYTFVTESVNKPADFHAVDQMQHYVDTAIDSGSEIETAKDVRELLFANDYRENLMPNLEGYQFGWYTQKQSVVIIKDGKIVYPTVYSSDDISQIDLLFVKGASTTEDLQNFIDGLETNGSASIILDGNISYEGALNFNTNGGDIEIDGNGHTITIKSAEEGSFNNVFSGNNSVVLKNLIINNQAAGYNGALVPKDNANITATGCAFIGSSYIGMAINAGQANEVGGSFDNCVFDGKNAAVHINKGTWKFTNCTFNGVVYVNGGSVEFENCIFNAKFHNSASEEWGNPETVTALADALNASEALLTLSNGLCYTNVSLIVNGGYSQEFYPSGTVTVTNCTFNDSDKGITLDVWYDIDNAHKDAITDANTLTLIISGCGDNVTGNCTLEGLVNVATPVVSE